ncbi:hypothetical protein J6590_078652 [Homalodisca vitripennis]|nr:hypothetical protein J6590_078652 [Homalodisca vitripennis]
MRYNAALLSSPTCSFKVKCRFKSRLEIMGKARRALALKTLSDLRLKFVGT